MVAVIENNIILLWCVSVNVYFLGITSDKSDEIGSLTLGGDALQHKALKIISDSVGFHRVNVSMMMSGAFWLVFCLKELVSTKHYWYFILPSCFIIFLAMALTGGRTGYGTWAVLGGFIVYLSGENIFY